MVLLGLAREQQFHFMVTLKVAELIFFCIGMKTKPSEHFVRMYLNGKIYFWIKKNKFLAALILSLFLQS